MNQKFMLQNGKKKVQMYAESGHCVLLSPTPILWGGGGGQTKFGT